MSTILRALEKVEGDQRVSADADLSMLARTDVANAGDVPAEKAPLAVPGDPFRAGAPRRRWMTRSLAVVGVLVATAGMSWLLFEDPTAQPTVAATDPAMPAPAASAVAAPQSISDHAAASVPTQSSALREAPDSIPAVSSEPPDSTGAALTPGPTPALPQIASGTASTDPPSPTPREAVPTAAGLAAASGSGGTGSSIPEGTESPISGGTSLPVSSGVAPPLPSEGGVPSPNAAVPQVASAPSSPEDESTTSTRPSSERVAPAPIAASELLPERVQGLEGVQTISARELAPPPAAAPLPAVASPPPSKSAAPAVAVTAPVATRPKTAPRRRAPARVAVIPPPPSLTVERTTWHPTPERREARVIVEGFAEPLDLHEGDAVGVLVVSEIQPSAVVFLHGGGTLRRKVGR